MSITRVPGLSYGVVCVILDLAVLVEHRLVTDGRTFDDGKYRAIAWRRAAKTENACFFVSYAQPQV